MPMNNRLLVPQKLPLLLDYAPGAAAAYSLRALSNSYVGPVVTVRRSTDSAEADFTATEVSDGTLAAWCGGGDGFVKVWWDQSGNGRDATQATAAAQPKLVSSGVLVTEGEKAAVQFDGVNDSIQAASVTLPAHMSAFFVSKTTGFPKFLFEHSPDTNTTDGMYVFGTYYAAWAFRRSGSIHYGPSVSGEDWIGNAQAIGTLVYDGAGYIYKNGGFLSNATASGTARPNTETTNNLYIGARGGSSLFMTGTFSELLIYPSDMTALRTRIEGDLAWYY
jgi:hypothetical protein